MWYIIIISVLVLGLLIGTGCKISTDKNKNMIENTNIPKDSTSEIYSRKDLEKLLKDLSKSNPKNLEEMGAMCYEMAMPPDRAEYVCPTCGEKTLYTDNYAELISWELQNIRNSVTKLEEVGGKLDESQFCKHCSPDITEPQLCLIVKLKDESEQKVCKINNDDLVILGEFLSGSKVHRNSYDAEEPLKYYIPRIGELIGIDIQKYINE